MFWGVLNVLLRRHRQIQTQPSKIGDYLRGAPTDLLDSRDQEFLLTSDTSLLCKYVVFGFSPEWSPLLRALLQTAGSQIDTKAQLQINFLAVQDSSIGDIVSQSLIN